LANQGKLGYINKIYVAYRKNSATSVISSNLPLVLAKYWQAIVYATALQVDRGALEQCTLQFYRDLVFSAIARGKPGSISGWGQQIMRDYPAISRWMLLRSWFSIPAVFCKEAIRALATLLLKGGARILHDK
jgi:hypothetical protein